jgi:hypothetical protein
MNKKQIQKKIDSYLNIETFQNLSFNYQVSIIIRAYEVNENVDWSISGDIDWMSDVESIKILISDYEKEYSDRRFAYGEVPINLIIERVMLSKDLSTQISFEHYHEFYGKSRVDSMFMMPILVDDREDEYIEDGWNRLHNYYEKGFKEIEVVKYL